MDKRVEKYIEKQKSPQKEIVKKLRKIILETFPNIKEELQLGVPWYEEQYYIVALKDHVNLGFSLKGLKKKMRKKMRSDNILCDTTHCIVLRHKKRYLCSI